MRAGVYGARGMGTGLPGNGRCAPVCRRMGRGRRGCVVASTVCRDGRRGRKGSETILPVFAPSLTMVAEAAECLGWAGDVVGPVSFGGVCFWAVADVSRSGGGEGRPEVRLSGCLLAGHAGPALLQEASLLAAYTPRAVLVGGSHDLTGVLVDAAILDQGVVVAGANGVQLLATAGPRVAFGPTTPREQELLRRVYTAWREAATVSVPEVESPVVTLPTVSSW